MAGVGGAGIRHNSKLDNGLAPAVGGGVTVARGQMGAWPGSRVKGCWPRPGNSGSLDTLFRAELLCITNVGGGAGTRNTNVAI